MQELLSILVVLDKPKHEQVALARAVDLARAAGAHLDLVSFCWVPMVERREVFDTHQRRALKRSALAERRRWLEGIVLDTGLSAADASTEVVWTNDISGWIAERQATARAGALVVKSAHHSRPLRHTPLDWALLRHCPVPLLLVSTAPRTPSGRVLLAVDVDRSTAARRRLTERVVATGAMLAGLVGGRLHTVTAVDPVGSFEDLEFFDADKMARRGRDVARRQLAELLAGYDVARRRIHVPVGKVGQAVTTVAEEIGADVVVLGSGTRRGLGARLLGSAAEKILDRVSCDVLAIHV